MVSMRIFMGIVVGASATNEFLLDMPPRLQWNENQGYCGEVSLISAGLYFGQYLSQYDSRIAACGDKNQNKCQMLLGVSDESAAAKMHFASSEWKTIAERDTKDFLLWIKQTSLGGSIPIIGVFTNECIFYNECSATAGDAEYDHIVPVLGIKSNHPLTDTSTYYGDDVIVFSDNGLYGTPPKVPYPYLFNYTFDAFQASRKQANDKNGAIYSLPNTGSNYGLAIKGLKDPNNELIPVRITTDVNYESPEIGRNSNTRPEPMKITLTVTVTNTVDTTKFTLYKYDELSKVPESDFHTNAKNAIQSWNITLNKGQKYTMTEVIQSNEVAVYRCVRS